MFKKARKELHKQLSQWTFSLITRGITVPASCVVNDEVTHYYTTADELAVSPNKRTSTIWLKKKARWVGSRWFGPIGLSEESSDIPKAGEIVMGEIMVVPGSQKEFGRQKCSMERQTYKWWMRSGAPMYYLALMVLKGTSETEKSLRSTLKLPGDFDDLWVLARIVLFNNIQCVVDLLQPGNGDKVKLHTNPVKFIHDLSVFLQDMSLLTEFQKRAPATVIPPPGPPGPPGPQEPPQQREKVFVGRKRRATVAVEEEEYNPEHPGYDFSHRKPAGETSSPPTLRHRPVPSYAPGTPPYVPASPPYAPETPPYAPETPPYVPASPPYYPPLCDM